jgi:hypothetical protein
MGTWKTTTKKVTKSGEETHWTTENPAAGKAESGEGDAAKIKKANVNAQSNRAYPAVYHLLSLV